MNQALAQVVALHQMLREKDIGEFYGEPIASFQARRKFKPQIVLHFLQPPADIKQNYPRLDGRISFRLMGEESTTITDQKMEAWARKIKNRFGGTTPLEWRRGKELWCYADWDKGYQLQLLVEAGQEAKRIVEQILDIQGHSPDWKNLFRNTNEQPFDRYDETPGSQLILGKMERRPRQRPLARLVFTYAELHLHGLPKPKVLYSVSSKRVGIIE